MSDRKQRIRIKKKSSIRKKILSLLGIRHTTRRTVIFYVIVFFILALLVLPLVKFFLGVAENFGKDYYAPRDFERVEKLKREGNPIPFLPKKKDNPEEP
ncbi:MAG: hypothetical protein GY941_11875 [Planctomycetes bacterium]|nr:hypothetical protein [Planctomycetota bacterium]